MTLTWGCCTAHLRQQQVREAVSEADLVPRRKLRVRRASCRVFASAPAAGLACRGINTSCPLWWPSRRDAQKHKHTQPQGWCILAFLKLLNVGQDVREV